MGDDDEGCSTSSLPVFSPRLVLSKKNQTSISRSNTLVFLPWNLQLSNFRHLKTTHLYNMTTGKMDDVAAARIRKARGAKV